MYRLVNIDGSIYLTKDFSFNPVSEKINVSELVEKVYGTKLKLTSYFHHQYSGKPSDIYYCEFENETPCVTDGGHKWIANGIMLYKDELHTHSKKGSVGHVLVPYKADVNIDRDIYPPRHKPDLSYHSDFFSSPLGKNITVEEYLAKNAVNL